MPGAGGADGDMACVVCGEEEAHTPYVTDCGHIFCYYCLKLNCIQDDQFACPRCVRAWYLSMYVLWCWSMTSVHTIDLYTHWKSIQVWRILCNLQALGPALEMTD